MLKKQGFDVKAQSGLEDEQVAIVKSKMFAGGKSVEIPKKVVAAKPVIEQKPASVTEKTETKKPEGTNPSWVSSNYKGKNPNSNYNNMNRNNGASTGGSNNSTQGNRPNNNNATPGNRTNNNNATPGNRPNNNNANAGNRPNNNNATPGNRPYNNNATPGNRPVNANAGNRPNNNNNNNANAGNRPNNNNNNNNGNANTNNNTYQGNKSAFGNNKPGTGVKKNQHYNVRGTNQVNRPAPRPNVPAEPIIRNIALPVSLTIQELADKIKTPVSQLIKKLFLAGEIVNVNTDLDYEKAAEIALEYNCIAEEEVVIDVIEEMLKEEEDDDALLTERPPVICVMGHVDHGKTSLLDAIRQANVTTGEAGGITQHIGAYVVKCQGQKITFLDTPGHEAFTAMRMRGAQATDIAILVVAADDGVMPQTIEAINHAKAAGIEIIVAINKIDKESANIERVKQELMEYELVAEDWGGSTVFCPVSAHTKEGIENLLEMIILTAEVLELKANSKRKARGIVIEAELDKGRGPVATVLVQKGTLKIGESIAVGNVYGKVRAMIDDKGRRLKEATPSTPVEILGLNGVPGAGEIFISTESDKEARTMAATFIAYGKEKLLADTKAKLSLDDLFSQIQAGNVKELNLVVKGDVQGSVEAVKQSLLKLSNEEVVIKVIHAGVGAINESDVILASASNAIIIGFNIRPDATAKETAEREKVDLRLYKVIYNAIEDIEAAMKGMLDPIYEEKIIGHAEIRQTFKASGIGTIAGSYVLDGVIERGSSVRINREGKLIFEGKLASLKRFKDEVKEVKHGFECGLVFENYNEIQEFDIVEAWKMVEVPR